MVRFNVKLKNWGGFQVYKGFFIKNKKGVKDIENEIKDSDEKKDWLIVTSYDEIKQQITNLPYFREVSGKIGKWEIKKMRNRFFSFRNKACIVSISKHYSIYSKNKFAQKKLLYHTNCKLCNCKLEIFSIVNHLNVFSKQ